MLANQAQPILAAPAAILLPPASAAAAEEQAIPRRPDHKPPIHHSVRLQRHHPIYPMPTNPAAVCSSSLRTNVCLPHAASMMLAAPAAGCNSSRHRRLSWYSSESNSTGPKAPVHPPIVPLRNTSAYSTLPASPAGRVILLNGPHAQ